MDKDIINVTPRRIEERNEFSVDRFRPRNILRPVFLKKEEKTNNYYYNNADYSTHDNRKYYNNTTNPNKRGFWASFGSEMSGFVGQTGQSLGKLSTVFGWGFQIIFANFFYELKHLSKKHRVAMKKKKQQARFNEL